MSWKSIELQVALPRTQDAGKLQEQMLKQNQHYQESLAQSQLKDLEQKRKKVQNFDQVQHLNVKNDNENQSINNSDIKINKHSDYPMLKHPYLGKHFDSVR